MPAGIDKKKLWTVWRNLIWARASENLAVVVTTQNLFDETERGLAMVAQPEEIVFEADGPGTFLVDVDLTRIREMREQEDGPKSSEEYGAKPGVLTQWQRPEMQDKVYPSDPHLEPAPLPDHVNESSFSSTTRARRNRAGFEKRSSPLGRSFRL